MLLGMAPGARCDTGTSTYSAIYNRYEGKTGLGDKGLPHSKLLRINNRALGMLPPTIPPPATV